MPQETSERTKHIVVLVVDDEPDVRDIIGFDLDAAGLRYIEAASGREALGIVKKQKVDVVISDIRMPDGDGVELLDALKMIDHAIPPVIFVSGHSDYRIEDLYDKGVEALFAKPINSRALIDVVLAALQPKKELWSRRYNRVEAKVRVKAEVSAFGEARSTHIMNLGRGGMFLAMPTESMPKVGESFQFSLSFLDRRSPPIEGQGVARWIRTKASPDMPTGIGFEFVHIEGQGLHWIVELINDLKTKAYIPKN